MSSESRTEPPPASGTSPRERPLLRLAFDFVDSSEAARILSATAPLIDIAEVGTSMLKTEGVWAIERVRRAIPGTDLLVDAKTMDDAAYEAGLVFEAGADLTTVCAGAADATVTGVVAEARRHRRAVVGDLVGARATPHRLSRLSELGVDFIGVHNGSDERANSADLATQLRTCESLGIGNIQLSGGISPESVRALHTGTPAILVVGGYVLDSTEPCDAVRRIRKAMHERFGGTDS
ncbi:3-hexulose-6-phosphate synthase [Actinopolyspora lacussalsi subsp. righensis]|uniref:3-hexulose-6-phosphate synthase n=1 Tax=Actinopolyspora righensis TaxID=995060 RepID=A0A1I6YUJ3_9ACTN|nr:orotidine 5'-phosphate decarboxylase / HUMPS family protein [Actinopolyspora righensis]SFT54122.1 3-hexulose-6-phosphate synthase [Actinopolyspora righensis]